MTDKHGKGTRDMTSERTKALIRTDKSRKANLALFEEEIMRRLADRERERLLSVMLWLSGGRFIGIQEYAQAI